MPAMKTKLIVALGIVLFGFLVPALGDVCVSTPLKVRRMCGTTVDPVAIPLSNVHITLLKDGKEVASTTTDDTGEFDFDVRESGSYELELQADGFVHERYPVKLHRPARFCKQALSVKMEVGMVHCQPDIHKTDHGLVRRH